jgi:hypothetical protein
MRPWAVFDNEGGEGGGGEGDHWAGDEDLANFADEKGFKSAADVVKAHKDLTSKHWAGDDKDLTAFADTKGWKDGATALTAYRELEKKMGSMAPIPGADASDEDYEKFAAKLRGRNVGEYADVAPEGLPEDVYDEGLATSMKNAALEAGIPPRMFSKVWGAYWKAVGEQVADLDKKATEVRTEDEKTMRVKWGTDYDSNLALAGRAMEKTGAGNLPSDVRVSRRDEASGW